MSALTKLAAVRMEERLILETLCAGCGHQLRSHPPTLNGTPCHHHHVVSHASKDPNKARIAYCKCKAWVDADEKLDLS